MGVEQDIHVGGSGNFGLLNVLGLSTLASVDITDAFDVTSTSAFAISANTISFTAATTTTFNSAITSVAPIHVTSTVNAVDTATGALIVDGGVAIAQDLHIGGDLYIGGSFDGNYSGNFSGNFAGDLIGTFSGDILSGSQVTGDFIIQGDLTVMGTSTVIDTETLSVKDNIIVLNSGLTTAPPSSLISGIEVNRGTSDNYRFMFRESDLTFRIGSGFLTLTVVDGTSFVEGELVTDLTTGATGTIILVDVNDLSINQTTVDAVFGIGNTLESTSATSIISNVVDNDQTQAVATRSDVGIDGGVAVWDAGANMFSTTWKTATEALLLTGGKYMATTGITTLTLPAIPVDGQGIQLHDRDNEWFDVPVTIEGNGNNIMGVLENLVLNIQGSTVDLIYTTSQGWRIV